MTIEIAIVLGLGVLAYLNWKALQQTELLESIVVQMLLDLGKQGILNVRVQEEEEEDEDSRDG